MNTPPSAIELLGMSMDELNTVDPTGETPPSPSEAADTLSTLGTWHWERIRNDDVLGRDVLVAAFFDDGAITLGRWGGRTDEGSDSFLISGNPHYEGNCRELFRIWPRGQQGQAGDECGA